MADENTEMKPASQEPAGDAGTPGPEPRGFGEHTRRAASENAHQQGWGLNQEERTRLPQGKQAWEGGTDYDYGARDFGDTATDTSGVQPAESLRKDVESEGSQRTSASRG